MPKKDRLALIERFVTSRIAAVVRERVASPCVRDAILDPLLRRLKPAVPADTRKPRPRIVGHRADAFFIDDPHGL
jgi:hypothetical protein